MKILRFAYPALLLLVIGFSVQARDFRSIQPIARPAAVPDGATAVTEVQPIPRFQVEQAVQAVAEAWNDGALDPLVADSFASKSRLLDTIAEVVPRDARLTVLGIQAVSTLAQYRREDKVISSVSAVVRSQIEFNDPVTGFQRLEGTGEWYFQVEEDAVTTLALNLQGLRTGLLLSRREKVAEWNETLRTMPRPTESTSFTPPPGLIPVADNSDWSTLTAPPADPNPEGAYIDNVTPTDPRWEDMLTITGGNFGSPIGQVDVLLKHSRRRVFYRVVSWSDRAVTAVVRERGLETLRSTTDFHPGPMPGLVSLEPYSIDLKRVGKEVVFQPSARLLSPEISDILSGEPAVEPPISITPGQHLRIFGHNFLSRPGAVSFRIGSRIIPGEIIHWSEGEIEAALPSDIESVVAGDATLSVMNYLSYEGEAPIRFIPRMDIDEIEGEFVVSCDERGICRSVSIMTQPLLNGWLVLGGFDHETSTELYGYRGLSGTMTPFCPSARFEWPERGSSDPTTTITPSDGCGEHRVEGKVWFAVSGPTGTSHGHRSRRP